MSDDKHRTDELEEIEWDDSLVGSFFHSFKDDDVNWQGVVVARPEPGIYLVELFEWLAGSSSAQRLVRIEDMLGWQFYDTPEWMSNAYERHPSTWRARRKDAREETDDHRGLEAQA